MINVTWQIVEIDQEKGEVTVEFSDGNLNQNRVWYKWEGDIQQMIERISQQAHAYQTYWWISTPISDEIKTQLIGLTGSGSDYNPSKIVNQTGITQDTTIV